MGEIAKATSLQVLGIQPNASKTGVLTGRIQPREQLF